MMGSPILNEKFPRRLIFVTRCGCTKTMYEGAGRRGGDREHRLPLEQSTRVDYINGDLPSDLMQRMTTYYRVFILEEVHFDRDLLRYDLVYREKG